MDDSTLKLNAEKYCFIRYKQYSSYENYAKKFGLGYKNLFVLRTLYDATEGCTQIEICKNAMISKQTVSAIIKIYIKKGYVRMEQASKDRRNKFVSLTDEGRKYVEGIIPHIIKAEQEAMSEFTAEEQEYFIAMCSKYADRLYGFFNK